MEVFQRRRGQPEAGRRVRANHAGTYMLRIFYMARGRGHGTMNAYILLILSVNQLQLTYL